MFRLGTGRIVVRPNRPSNPDNRCNDQIRRHKDRYYTEIRPMHMGLEVQIRFDYFVKYKMATQHRAVWCRWWFGKQGLRLIWKKVV